MLHGFRRPWLLDVRVGGIVEDAKEYLREADESIRGQTNFSGRWAVACSRLRGECGECGESEAIYNLGA